MKSVKASLGPIATALLLTGILSLGLVPVAGQNGIDAFGVSPGSVTIPDAVAGETYLRNVELQNNLDSETQVQIDKTGTVGQWTSLQVPDQVTVPAYSHLAVPLEIQVPTGTPDGTYSGQLHLTALAAPMEDGSGFAIQHSVAVPITVHVGTDHIVSIQYLLIEAQDIELGDTPRVQVEIVNAGNVRTTAVTHSAILRAQDDEEVARGVNTTTLDPGEQKTLQMEYDDATPPLGTYKATAGPTTDPRHLQADFKVVPPGTLGKDLLVRELLHPPRVAAGETVRIEAPVVNTGQASIGQARLIGEVYHNDRLVGTFESPTRNLAMGEELRLVAYYTPEQTGRHILEATVVYDGFETPPVQSLMNVETAGGYNLWLILAPLVSFVLFVLVFILLSGRRRRDPDHPQGRRHTPAGARVQSRRQAPATARLQNRPSIMERDRRRHAPAARDRQRNMGQRRPRPAPRDR